MTVHWFRRQSRAKSGSAACGARKGVTSSDPARVNCRACRRKGAWATAYAELGRRDQP